MGKRKREKIGGEKPPKQSSKGHTAMHTLLGSTIDVDRFLQWQWEQKPVVFKAASFARTRQLAALFNLAKVWEYIKASEQTDRPFKQGWDINCVRFKDGKRETLQDHKEATCETWQQLYKEGWSMQVHQPQRFCDALTELCSSLENQLGCLVGSNAYLTPQGAQGLAPHHDDVEIFVVQTEGRKRWRLYAPLDGLSLPSTHSNDLSEDIIGDPIMDLTLEVGDVLYLPRGTIHAAATDNESASCHVTISTYQQWTYANLAQHLLQTLMAGQTPEACLPFELRQGLPIGFLYEHGLQHEALNLPEEEANGTRSSPAFKSDGCSRAADALAKGLRKLADAVEKEPALLSLAADSMAVDFMESRLPPSKGSLPDVGEAPTLSSLVRCRGPGLFRMMPLDAPDAPDDSGEGWVKVMSCLNNDVESHMMGEGKEGCTDEDCDKDNCGHKHENHDQSSESGDGGADEDKASGGEEDSGEESDEASADLVFPASYSVAIAQLLATAEPEVEGIPVSEIKMPAEEHKLGLASTLWIEGVIFTVPQAMGS